jgi:hypothetical protein
MTPTSSIIPNQGEAKEVSGESRTKSKRQNPEAARLEYAASGAGRTFQVLVAGFLKPGGILR